MAGISIVTDSCASIPETLINSLNIHWVPYYIHWGKEVLRDLVTIKRKEFYNRLRTTKTFPQTASPGPGDYLQMYQAIREEQEPAGILSIHMTSKGSGAYQAALAARDMARELIPDLKIEVLDTLNVSLCHGWMVIEAARAALAGKCMGDIVARVKQMIPISKMFQTADTLRYLYMGGRIGKAKQLMGSLLNIKPIIGMENGVIVPLGQARSRKRAYRLITDKVESAAGAMGKIKVAYVHAAAREEAEKLKEILEKKVTVVEPLIAELSPALGVHTGPGTVGVCFFPIS